MPYQRTFSTLGCPELSLHEVMALAVRHQLTGVELRALGGTVDLPAYFAQEAGSPSQLAKKQSAQRIRILALDTSFQLVDQSAAGRDALLQFVPWAEALGVPRLRVFDGGKTGDTAGLDQMTATLAWWRELRARHSWTTDLMVETHDSLFTSATLGRFLAAAPDAGILWDTHHTWKQGGEDPVATWQAVKSHVVHIHVKDSVSRPSAKHPYTYVLPGSGEFPAAPLLAALRAANYSGPVSLEWEKLWHPYLPPLDEALAAARNWW
jgi:sugar phosphate isomerase/epimerase